MENAEIGIIGGTGIYDPGLLEDSKELSIETPYGAPSEKITVGQYNGKKVSFPRHIPYYHILNYRANSGAWSKICIHHLVEKPQRGFAPLLPSQYFTKTRNGYLCIHRRCLSQSTADPFCPQMCPQQLP